MQMLIWKPVQRAWEIMQFLPELKYARVSNDININTSLGINDLVVAEDYSEIDLLTGFCQSFAKWQRQS